MPKKRLQFGGELELKGLDVKDSTIVCRNLFLKLIVSLAPKAIQDLMKPCRLEDLPDDARVEGDLNDRWIRFFLLHLKFEDLYSEDLNKLGCASNIRDTPILAYFDYFHRNKSEFDQLLCDAKEKWQGYADSTGHDIFVKNDAIKAFIPNWQTLQSKPGANWLCSVLSTWKDDWHLEGLDDWCLDFALGCLRNFKVKFVDKFNPGVGYPDSSDRFSEFRRFWYSGFAWHDQLEEMLLEQIFRTYPPEREIPQNIEQTLTFNYSWPESLTADETDGFVIKQPYLPLIFSLESFVKTVEEEFWLKFCSYFGNRVAFCVSRSDDLACQIKTFDKKLKGFLKAAHQKLKPFTDQTPSKDDDRHLRWLVEYQVNRKSQTLLAKETKKSRKAIDEGIKSVAEIIGLQLRPPSSGGKPKGTITTEYGAGRIAYKNR